MKVRIQSVFSSGALVLLLSLTLLYGCRAFDPAPVIVNRPPNTFLVGAPAEDTGTSFRRHLRWFGSDTDGSVVQYIYAITDSSVIDREDPETDEENDRFNPADDVTTLDQSRERFVGWTTQTDSVFVFTIDRGSSSSKDITFHIVAVDDRGAIDPTPARLHFFNNALGNPQLRFSVFVDVDPVTGEGGRLAWRGSPTRGPEATGDFGEPLEQSDQPRIGFLRPFRIEWDASTPNAVEGLIGDPILGYRFKARQGIAFAFSPDIDEFGTKLFGDTQSFFYANNVPAETLQDEGESCSADDGVGCDPARLRWVSGSYSLSVEALDQALVESETSSGNLRFQVNYPPETILAPTAEYVLRDDAGVEIASGSIVDGGRVPIGAEITFVSTGFDKFSQTLPAGVPDDVFCCDEPFIFDPNDPANSPVPEVRFQERVVVLKKRSEDDPGQPLQTFFGEFNDSGSVEFTVGPYEYTFISTTVDEHGRADPDPAEFNFTVGEKPTIDLAASQPAMNSTIIVRYDFNPTVPAVWPESEFSATSRDTTLFYLLDPTADCGARWVDRPEGAVSISGRYFSFRPVLRAQSHPDDPKGNVNAWSFALRSLGAEGDESNKIIDGLESRDLGFFLTGTEVNELDFSSSPAGGPAGLGFFVPLSLIISKDPFINPEVDLGDANAKIGCLIRKQIGEVELSLRGRVTGVGEEFDFFAGRDANGELILQSEDVEELGKKTDPTALLFRIQIGFAELPGGATLFSVWPDLDGTNPPAKRTTR